MTHNVSRRKVLGIFGAGMMTGTVPMASARSSRGGTKFGDLLAALEGVPAVDVHSHAFPELNVERRVRAQPSLIARCHAGRAARLSDANPVAASAGPKVTAGIRRTVIESGRVNVSPERISYRDLPGICSQNGTNRMVYRL